MGSIADYGSTDLKLFALFVREVLDQDGLDDVDAIQILDRTAARILGQLNETPPAYNGIRGAVKVDPGNSPDDYTG